MRILFKFFLLILLAFTGCSRNVTKTVNYYFDPVEGNDSLNSGTSPSKPLRSLSLISKLLPKPGDSVLLKSGALFEEPLYINCSGDSGNQVVFGKYGGEEKPWIKINGSAQQAIHAFNSEYITIRDIEVSNRGREPTPGLNGVLVELKNYGTAHDIVIDNLYVHDVYGSLVDTVGGGAGIRIKNYIDGVQDTVSSRFDGLIIENCLLKDCTRDGIMMWGNWIRSKWNPSLNVIIRNNILDGIPGHGIVPVGCLKPLVEYNVMKNCPDIIPEKGGTADGIWPWGCDSALVQYNVVSDMAGFYDGFGFDSDYNCQGSIFQYNLSFNNEGGFLLICNPGGWPSDWCIGNSGTIIRYNISINDGIRTRAANEHGQEYFSPVVNVTGPTDNTLIEKNLFFLLKKENRNSDKTLVHYTDWRGYADSTIFRNNFIYSEEANIAWKPTRSTNSDAKNNLYEGILTGNLQGFSIDENTFKSKLWFDRNDKNWDLMMDFLKDKKVFLDAKEIPVWEFLQIEN